MDALDALEEEAVDVMEMDGVVDTSMGDELSLLSCSSCSCVGDSGRGITVWLAPTASCAAAEVADWWWASCDCGCGCGCGMSLHW